MEEGKLCQCGFLSTSRQPNPRSDPAAWSKCLRAGQEHKFTAKTRDGGRTLGVARPLCFGIRTRQLTEQGGAASKRPKSSPPLPHCPPFAWPCSETLC